MRAGRVPALVVDLRNKLEDSGLAPHVMVVGTHALYAHEAHRARRAAGADGGDLGVGGGVALAVGFEPLALADPEWASTSEPRTGH